MPGIIRVRRPPLLYRRPAVVAAPSLLLDAISVSASAAYSSRKLRAAYAGNPLTGTSTQTGAGSSTAVPFSGNDLDQTALAAIGSSVYLNDLFDQSGNARNGAYNGTTGKRPELRGAGTLRTINGRSVARSADFDCASIDVSSITLSTTWTVGFVIKNWTTINAFRTFIDFSNGSTQQQIQTGSPSSGLRVYAQTASTIPEIAGCFDGTAHAALIEWNGTISSHIYLDGVDNVVDLRSATTPSASLMKLIGLTSSGAGNLEIIEYCFWSGTALSAGDKTAYFNNVRSYWGTP